MIARQAPARILARKRLFVRAKKPCRNPENVISDGLPTGDHNALKSGKLVYLLTLIPHVLKGPLYILSVGGKKLSVHLARQLQNIYKIMNIVPYLLERV